MKLVRNTGTDRVIDMIRPMIGRGHLLDIVTSAFSLFAFADVNRELGELEGCRLVLPPSGFDLAIVGTVADRPARNRLQHRWLAKRMLSGSGTRRKSPRLRSGAFVCATQTATPCWPFSVRWRSAQTASA
jgi:hypothetical protein